MTWFNSKDNFNRAYDKFNRIREEEIHNYVRSRGGRSRVEKLKIIYTPPKKPIEEQRLRPKFRRKKLGKITIWTTGILVSPLFKIAFPDRYEMRIQVEGEEGFGEVPKELIKQIQEGKLVVEGVTNNNLWGIGAISKRRFLYECIVHSQYVEFEEF